MAGDTIGINPSFFYHPIRLYSSSCYPIRLTLPSRLCVCVEKSLKKNCFKCFEVFCFMTYVPGLPKTKKPKKLKDKDTQRQRDPQRK